MTSLTIQCRYIAHSYTGVRHGRDGRDELDWPPSPARLHQAFIASTLANLPDSERAAFSDKTLGALRWLESLPPPEIIASKLADDSEHRRALLVAMPHNSPAKGDFSRYHPDLAPVLRATPEHDGELSAAYRWMEDAREFCRKAELHLPALREAAAKLRYMGRAEDRVECEVQWHTNGIKEPSSESLEIWRPASQAEDINLLIARPKSTDELMAEFHKAEARIARGAKRPARLSLREQSYTRDAAEGLLPVHVAIFQILRDTGNPDQLPEACDAINAHRWRSPLRALACKAAEEVDRWNNPVLADELISGHHSGGGHTQQPHLAFAPLPSLSLGGKADGRVRRFALLGYSNPDNADAAASIYPTLALSLDGETIESNFRVQLIADPRKDKVWSLYTRASRRWVSVTPLVLARGYKVPTHAPDGTPLSSNERYLRRHAEWMKLVRSSLRDIRLPADLVDTCRIQLTSSPLLLGTERAERYRPKDERAPFIHARIEFSRPVRGPLLVGDRRYFGLGLFVPVADSPAAQPAERCFFHPSAFSP
jgi:CRISPR-associated protein Csb2